MILLSLHPGPPCETFSILLAGPLVINEPDFLPLHIVRQLAQAATLVRAARGKLVVTPFGESMLSEARQRSLLAILFHLAFWHMDLSYFGRGQLGSWPQPDAGVVLWSLSACAHDWQPAEKLTRLCTIPKAAMRQNPLRDGGYRPLLWFGLLEQQSEKSANGPSVEHRLYRKGKRDMDPIDLRTSDRRADIIILRLSDAGGWNGFRGSSAPRSGERLCWPC